MYIKKVHIQNFRLLREVNLFLEERTTVIVGRNNSGKTSLAELIRRLLSDTVPSFRLEDFSLSVYDQFWTAFVLKGQEHEENEIRDTLPFIEVKLTVNYDKQMPNLGLLGEFVIDLDQECTEAIIVARYQLKDGEINAFFNDIEYDLNAPKDLQKKTFFRTIRERIPKYYAVVLLAEDPTDPTNRKVIDLSTLRALMNSGFINAQRGLDDITHRDMDVLGKVLVTLFDSAVSDLADPKDRDVVQKLESTVRGIQDSIDTDFRDQLDELLPAFSLFGYPGLSDPKLCTETTLDVQRLLTNHTKLYYAGVNGINLPETYNGLGARNLIYILLKILEFFKSFKLRQPTAGMHLVFIEEPEVHLHPQMQEVFIRKLGEIADVFAKEFNNGIRWPVQFVVTTHSTHIANEAPFRSMRYFLAVPTADSDVIFTTQIKDLQKGLGGIPQGDQEFLHKYMTLTRCDLLFADKAVLIEGTAERLLLPRMIAIVDEALSPGCKLSSQYISVVEVGGAYAHRFFQLLDFLELPTLVITDLDSVKRNAENRLIACKVSEGTNTSNGCIKDWFEDTNISPSSLIGLPDHKKVRGFHRLAYQVPETSEAPCGRSFEDAFILANPDMFDLTKASIEDSEDEAYEKAKTVRKTEFALEYALEKTQWFVPRYIADGLSWLAKGPLLSDVILSPAKSGHVEKDKDTATGAIS
ncbi:MAG TPA: ATP-dependent endonuclease [Syntrophorhabdaceae bacterium]|nr:ATP-dependent endonuclease [Syntrophorhabdaceae bacterium]